MASDQPDFSGSAMIALYPPPDVVDQLVLPGGEDPAELHCTVAYLGDVSDVDLKAVLGVAATVARRAPVDGSIAGHARFTGCETDVQVALVDSPQLEQLRRDLVDALTATGIEIPRDHGYTAHITQLYLDPGGPSPVDRIDPIPVTFAVLSVVHGERRIDIPFGDPAAETIAPYAKTAFAQGWAASGGPLTERVKAGCTAAVQLAVDNAHDPDILEVTLHLGHLEGTWANVYERREALYAKHIAAVTTAWRHAARRVDIPTAVRRFRQSLGLGEAADPNDTTHRQLIAKAIAAAVATAIAGEGASPTDREAIITAIADGMKAAEAEGYAGAVAVGADQLGVIGVSFDLAFQHAWDALGDLGTYWGDAHGWLDRILNGNAADLGAKLSGLAADGASFDDMVDAAGEIVGGADVRAVSTLVDLAMGQSFSRGALSLYASEGVQTVDYSTAGDGRVCPICQSIEAKNPWPRNEIPAPPRHPYCRCAVTPHDPMEALNFTKFLDTGGS